MHTTAREPAPDSHSPGARMTPGTTRRIPGRTLVRPSGIAS